jgi:hypothetical protein
MPAEQPNGARPGALLNETIGERRISLVLQRGRQALERMRIDGVVCVEDEDVLASGPMSGQITSRGKTSIVSDSVRVSRLPMACL